VADGLVTGKAQASIDVADGSDESFFSGSVQKVAPGGQGVPLSLSESAAEFRDCG
jgi:hypothetical protein